MKKTEYTSLTHSFRLVQSSAGFSLVELLVTLSIIALLSGIMMPTVKSVRASAEKLMCANNMRSIYYGINGYAIDRLNSRQYMPSSIPHDTKNFKDTMAITAKDYGPKANQEWDGLGLLWRNKSMGSYLDNCKCLYCPSHHGEHSYERYKQDLEHSNNSLSPVNLVRQLFCNYQYAGGRDIKNGLRIPFNSPGNNVILTDGLRSKSDFNHLKGSNSLSNSGEVRWLYNEKFLNPNFISRMTDEVTNDRFSEIWTKIQSEVDR